LDDSELKDNNVSAEPVDHSHQGEAGEEGGGASGGFVPGVNELRKRVVNRPCLDWNSKKRLTVQGSKVNKRKASHNNNEEEAADVEEEEQEE
jgi:hypothetical protein